MARAMYSSGSSPYGPYYRWSQRAMQGQRVAMGQQPLSAGEIAAERYGEIAAQTQREAQLRADRRVARTLSLQEKAIKRQEAGEKIIGGVTGAVGAYSLAKKILPTKTATEVVAGQLVSNLSEEALVGESMGMGGLLSSGATEAAGATTGALATATAWAPPLAAAVVLLGSIFGGGDK